VQIWLAVEPASTICPGTSFCRFWQVKQSGHTCMSATLFGHLGSGIKTSDCMHMTRGPRWNAEIRVLMISRASECKLYHLLKLCQHGLCWCQGRRYVLQDRAVHVQLRLLLQVPHFDARAELQGAFVLLVLPSQNAHEGAFTSTCGCSQRGNMVWGVAGGAFVGPALQNTQCMMHKLDLLYLYSSAGRDSAW